jgi:hypothetical protein
MENLLIQGTDCLPHIEMDTLGFVNIKGKAIPENADKLFSPVFEWLDNFKGDKLHFDIDLYYFNTAVSKQLYEVLFKAKNLAPVNNITVKWRYEEGDDDSFEAGMTYKEELPGIQFEFAIYAEV